MDEYDIDDLVEQMDFTSGHYQKVGKNIFLTNKEIEVLERYQIPYHNCQNLKEVSYLVEDLISDMDIVEDELDSVSKSIAERDYYQNTNK